MKKRSKKITAYVLSGILLCQPAVFHAPNDFTIVAEAHSGRTDSNGGHKDNKNKSGLGSYHYHCGGNPAHLHEGGVCPYSTTSASSVSEAGSVTSDPSGATSSNALSGSEGIKLSSGESITASKDTIKIVQDVLTQKGYDCGTIDGVAGTKTKEAIKQFLKDNEDSDSTDNMIITMVAEGLGIESYK